MVSIGKIAAQVEWRLQGVKQRCQIFLSKRKITLGVLVWLAGLLLFVASCSGPSASESETSQAPQGESPTDRLNIVFVLADDLDYALTQEMPNLRSLLVEGGTSFEN